ATPAVWARDTAQRVAIPNYRPSSAPAAMRPAGCVAAGAVTTARRSGRHPRAGSGEVGGREGLDVAGHDPAQTVDRMADPTGVSHDRDPLPLAEPSEPELRILPCGAGAEVGQLVPEHVEEPHLAIGRCGVRSLDGGHEHLLVVLCGDLPARLDADDGRG